MGLLGFKFDTEALERLGVWCRTNLTEERQDELADILDDVFDFTGIAGKLFEAADGKIFRRGIKMGVGTLPEEKK